MNWLDIFDVGNKALASLRLHSEEGDMVEVYFPTTNSTSSLCFVMRRGRWRVIFGKKEFPRPRFTVYIKPLCHKKFSPYGSNGCLYSSEEVCIYTSDELLTTRAYVNKEEQLHALSRARKTGEKILRGDFKYQERDFVEGENTLFEVCVAFWKDGKVRGSMMEQGNSLNEAIDRATARALVVDDRWKPVSIEDFSSLQIEMTIFSPIKFQINPKRIRLIDYTKGYVAKGPSSFGLYVPEVFNARKFLSTYDFFSSLAIVKGEMKRGELQKVKYLAFDVCDFLESEDRKDSISLYGTMPYAKSPSAEVATSLMNETAKQANDWLFRMQEDDGNILPVVQIFEKKFKQFDLIRLSFAIYAMAEWQKYQPTEFGREQLNRAIEYTAKTLLSLGVSEYKLYGLVYLAHTYCSVGEFNKAGDTVRQMTPIIYDFKFSPILYLQLLTLLERLKESGMQDYEIDRERIAGQCRREFESQRNSPHTDAASWAEAVVAFSYSDQEFSHTVAKWLVSHKLQNGAFRQSIKNSYTYTRGTSKIFEALAIYPTEYREEIIKSFAWLVSMQYTDQNTFFVEKDFKKWVIGGFRHDYCNADLWSDAASHYILGASRYLRSGDHTR